MAYGKPFTLRQLADLGWRQTTALKYDSAQFEKHLDIITVTGDNKIYKKRERKVSRNL